MKIVLIFVILFTFCTQALRAENAWGIHANQNAVGAQFRLPNTVHPADAGNTFGNIWYKRQTRVFQLGTWSIERN